MDSGHRALVEGLLEDGADAHRQLVKQLPGELSVSLPVDAQGITRAIDHLARAAGFSDAERRRLFSPHALNPAVMHARVFGDAPLAPETVTGAFVEGARVRAEALGRLADAVGGDELGQQVRRVLNHDPPPTPGDAGSVERLQATYRAQEQAALMIAARIDRNG